MNEDCNVIFHRIQKLEDLSYRIPGKCFSSKLDAGTSAMYDAVDAIFEL
ncbi:MAG: hypothetical protein ETSY2_25835 [Candidatus Entotheonella gemina]|uniref:Uncharacterized protein n=1 Tax=Candidatus Entotheonella gemina TaxID=1429439 RepID=W4M439_9BACT|nr:MAG: hypothetical protein ETSY2_25835 [Candidatus Entotheonella gemina]